MNNRLMQLSGALIGALFSTVAAAEIVTVQVSGMVQYLNDYGNALDGQVQVGQAVTGTYSYDTSAPDQEPAPEYGHYELDPGQVSMSFEIGSLTFASADAPQPNGLYVVDVINGSWDDAFHVGSLMNNLPLSNGGSVDYIDVDLHDPSATALSSDAIPEVLPELSSFENPGIHFSGQGNNGNYYDFEVRIESQQIAGDTTLPSGTFQIVAQISNLSDPGLAFGGALQPGMQISGSYRVDLSASDSEPSPEFGHFECPKTPGWGFTLTAGGYTFQSDSTTNPVFVDIFNSGQDSIHVITNPGTVEPGAMTAHYIDMHLDDGTGTALSSDVLSAEAPNLAAFGNGRILMIGGVDQSGNYWNIEAQVLSITGTAGEPSAPVVVTPASGFFVDSQLVEVAFLMPVGKVSETVSGTINGAPVPAWFTDNCRQFHLWASERDALICQDIRPLLQPGSNNASWTVQFNDGTSVTESVEWRLFE